MIDSGGKEEAALGLLGPLKNPITEEDSHISQSKKKQD
jgi:hypothetical protein